MTYNTQRMFAVQGMNVLLAPLLYTMPELDAFYCYDALLTRQCPRYVLKNMEGAHDACGLVDQLLAVFDPQLRTYLEEKSVKATRSEEHTSELQSLMRISYAVFCLKKKKTYIN